MHTSNLEKIKEPSKLLINLVNPCCVLSIIRRLKLLAQRQDPGSNMLESKWEEEQSGRLC